MIIFKYLPEGALIAADILSRLPQRKLRTTSVTGALDLTLTRLAAVVPSSRRQAIIRHALARHSAATVPDDRREGTLALLVQVQPNGKTSCSRTNFRSK